MGQITYFCRVFQETYAESGNFTNQLKLKIVNSTMKNLSLVLNVLLLAAVAHLYYLNAKNSKPAAQIVSSATPAQGGARIAYVNADTLDAKYEWLKAQKKVIEQRAKDAESVLAAKEEKLMKDAAALQERFQGGNMTQQQAEKEQQALQLRGQRLQEEGAQKSKSIAEEQKKAFDDLYVNVEAKLKTLSSQIGYEYIMSYQRGGQILYASDSLDITKEVLDMLNAKAENK